MKSIFMLDTKMLHHHPQNPRKDIGDISELTESIKAKGVLQNLTVVERPNCYEGEGYYVVIGNRRLEAAKAAGLLELPCVIANMTEKEQIETMLLENMQRADLTAKEQADGFQMMIDLGSSVDEISGKTGFARSTIYHRLNIAKLDGEALQENPQVTMQQLIMLEKIKSIEKRNEVLKLYGGSSNFEYMVEQAVNSEKVAAKREKVHEMLHEAGIPKSEKYKRYWEGGFARVQTIYLNLRDEIPTEIETGEFYIEDVDRIVIANEEKTKEADQKTPEEIAREKEKREKQNRLKELRRLEEEINRDMRWEILKYGTNDVDVRLTDEERKTAVLFIISRSTREIDDIVDSCVTGNDKDADELRERMTETILSKSADTILLTACIGYGNLINLYNNWSGEYIGDEDKTEFVNILKRRGLKLSDEAEKVLDGTSELFY